MNNEHHVCVHKAIRADSGVHLMTVAFREEICEKRPANNMDAKPLEI